MIKKNSPLFWFNNEEQYINGSTIAAVLQNMLNTAAEKPLFGVYFGDKPQINSNEKYTCTLKLSITPYMLKGAHCMTANVRLFIKYPSEPAEEKVQVLNIINKCLGFVTGGFNYETEDNKPINYTFCSNFSTEASGDPENIQSVYTSTIVVKGDMHITRGDGGILGDMVESYIIIGDKEYQVTGRTVETSCQANIESPVKAGFFRPDTEYVAFTNAKTLIILLRNDYIGRLLSDFSHGLLDDENNPFINRETGKPEMTLKELYPGATAEEPRETKSTYYIYEIKETRETGVYIALSITLIKKP